MYDISYIMNYIAYDHVYFVSVIRNPENGDPWKLNKKCVLYRQCTLFPRLKKFPWLSLKSTILEVHKELSKSYREGIDEKLKCMAQPYKTKALKK